LKAARASLFLLVVPALAAPKFYPDDPLERAPQPRHTTGVKLRKLSDFYDFYQNIFAPAGEHHSRKGLIPAQAVDTLGEAMNSEWYTRRHYSKRMSLAELTRGPGEGRPPDASGPWTIIAAKSEGITPGFLIRDRAGVRYLLKFDPLEYPELATSADVISAKFFYALGYFVPENHIVYFAPEQLRVGDDVELRDALGQRRKLTGRDVTDLLLNVPRNPRGKHRAVASRFLPGKPAGPFRFYGTRRDDPNDVVPHEHRRDLRGLSVFAAWLAHDDSRAINTLDMLVEEDGVSFLRHHLIDFGSTLGSASNGPNTPRNGDEYIFEWGSAAKQFFTLGLWVPRWARKKFPNLPAAGNFESKVFDPVKWVPEYPNPAFVNRLPDDAFWAAKQVMAFTDEEIRAIVATGQFSDPRAEKYLAETLIERRDKIGRAFFRQVLPLDRFAVREGCLVFEDLEVRHGLLDRRDYWVQWFFFDNETGRRMPLEGANSFRIPAGVSDGGYLSAEIGSADPGKRVVVYLQRRGAIEVVGVERTW
jgi:hypothetical protein